MMNEITGSRERLRRWRLLLGADEADGTGCSLAGADLARDRCLSALYDSERQGGLGSSSPSVARWLGDIREYFPASVVTVMQSDALHRLKLTEMLLQPETLATVQPDIHLVATLLSLNRIIPAKTRATARLVVRKLVEDLERRLANPLRQAVQGALNRSLRNRRPRHSEIDWPRTIRANLRHYQPEYRTIVPERRIGYGRKGSALKDVILCVDQSGSMAGSVVYSSIMAAVMASIRAVNTAMVVFDTAVVDLTPLLADPVEVLFGTQLGGGTDIAKALGYCQELIRRPADTVFVLVTDLYEGGNREDLLKRAAAIAASGCSMVCLLALDDRGKPSFDHQNAKALADFGIPAFACSPDRFPDLMAAALQKRDLRLWAEAHPPVF
jgi:Mg-chelatase subunit ChlD